MKAIVKILTAAALALCVLLLLSAVLSPKRNLAENRWEYAPSNYFASGVGQMPENSLDVVFIGSSQVYSAVSPMEIWKSFGITGYDCSSSGQVAWTSYYYLRNVLRRQSPRVAAVEMLALFSEPSNNEFNNRSAVDNLPFSPEKIQLARLIWKEQKNNESFFSYFLPVLRYHGRWKELRDTDFVLTRDYDAARGYDMRYGSMRLAEVEADDFPMLTQAPTDEETKINETAAEYFRLMAELCRERGIRLLLFRTPCAGSSREANNAMRRFAAECGAEFVDLNDPELWAEMDFRYDEDILDAMHVNDRGAKKVSLYLGRYLREHYALPDHRGEEAYGFWDRDCAVYEEELLDWKIRHCESGETLRALAMDENHELLLVGMENANPAFAEALGVMREPETMWIAHWDGANSELHCTDTLTGRVCGMEFEIDDTGIFLHGRNYMVGSGGLYYVVFDRMLGKIVDYGTVSPEGIVSRE